MLNVLRTELPMENPDPAADQDYLKALMAEIATSRDKSSFEILFNRFGPRIKGMMEKSGASPDLAEDLVQEVFLSLQVRGSSEQIENVQGYLFRMAATALIRRRERQKWDWPNHDILDDTIGISDEVSPERVLMGKEAVEQLLESLQALPPRHREALFLHRFEEMTYVAIAARMNTTVKAVDHLIQEDVVVPEEEDLNSELAHHRVQLGLLADGRSARTTAAVQRLECTARVATHGVMNAHELERMIRSGQHALQPCALRGTERPVRHSRHIVQNRRE